MATHRVRTSSDTMALIASVSDQKSPEAPDIGHMCFLGGALWRLGRWNRYQTARVSRRIAAFLVQLPYT
jgi:hypothetical protein